MYTKYQGIELIQSYFNNRNNVIEQCRNNISESSPSSLIVQKTLQVIKQNLLTQSPDVLGKFYPQFKQNYANNIHSPFKDDLDLEKMHQLMSNISFRQQVKTSNLLDGLFVSW